MTKVIRFVDGCAAHEKTEAGKKKAILAGLAHARRWISSALHEDDCLATRGQMCECGKVLAFEQVQAAAAFIRKAR